MKIEPYSRNITYSDKIKRYHNTIIEMWEDYATQKEIVEELVKLGCKKVNRKTVAKYIQRCLDECGLPHDYSMPLPKNPNAFTEKYHDKIAYLRNYLGYTQREIAKEIGCNHRRVEQYIKRCYEND